MGDRIFKEGLAGNNQETLVFTVTGQGGVVHDGVMEILQLLPHELLTVADLPDLMGSGGSGPTGSQHQIYILPVGIPDVFEKVSGDSAFDRDDFDQTPQDYRSVFCVLLAPCTP